MNATSLYVSTSRLVLQNEGEINQNWSDLYILVPYLRQSLSCAICDRLLVEPFTPLNVPCQHHVCKLCMCKVYTSKPLCPLCRKYDKYRENVQLRILLQCYKSLCQHIMSSPIFNLILRQKQAAITSGGGKFGSVNLVDFIEEGAKFHDTFKSESGLKRSDYSILPCIFANSETKLATVATPVLNGRPTADAMTNGSAVYSVLYTGIGNKIKIKKNVATEEETGTKTNFAKVRSKRSGCRCGNAAVTPGKLTCCGQRCPCYVGSKSCIGCKCRGCRNPYRPNGGKLRPAAAPDVPRIGIQVRDEIPNTCVNLTTHSNGTLSPKTTVTLPKGVNWKLPIKEGTLFPSTSYSIANFKDSHVNQNVARESFVITSKGSFKVVNVIATQDPVMHIQKDQELGVAQSKINANVETTFSNILLPHSSSSSLIDASHSRKSVSISSNLVQPITLSPIIATSSNTITRHIYKDGQLVAAAPFLATANTDAPPLVGLVTSSSCTPSIQTNNLQFQ